MLEANKLALKLVSAIAHREQSPEQRAGASDIRQRMFTLFSNSYEQVRRATIFPRWNEGDAEDIAPSLFAGRANSNIKKPLAATPPVVGVPTTNAAVPAVAAPAETNQVPIGMPGGNPLLNS